MSRALSGSPLVERCVWETILAIAEPHRWIVGPKEIAFDALARMIATICSRARFSSSRPVCHRSITSACSQVYVKLLRRSGVGRDIHRHYRLAVTDDGIPRSLDVIVLAEAPPTPPTPVGALGANR